MGFLPFVIAFIIAQVCCLHEVFGYDKIGAIW